MSHAYCKACTASVECQQASNSVAAARESNCPPFQIRANLVNRNQVLEPSPSWYASTVRFGSSSSALLTAIRATSRFRYNIQQLRSAHIVVSRVGSTLGLGVLRRNWLGLFGNTPLRRLFAVSSLFSGLTFSCKLTIIIVVSLHSFRLGERHRCIFPRPDIIN